MIINQLGFKTKNSTLKIKEFSPLTKSLNKVDRKSLSERRNTMPGPYNSGNGNSGGSNHLSKDGSVHYTDYTIVVVARGMRIVEMYQVYMTLIILTPVHTETPHR